MGSLLCRIVSAFFVSFALLVSTSASTRADLIASSALTKTASLKSLKNGLDAVTFVWSVDPKTQERAESLLATLASVVYGGSSSRSAREVSAFMRSKGINHRLDAHENALLLTVTAPAEVFPETIVHLENLLLEPAFSAEWYARARERVRLKSALKTRLPSDVLAEMVAVLRYPMRGDDQSALGTDIQFGRPDQVILRSDNPKVHQRVARLIAALPKGATGSPFARWAKMLMAPEESSFALPRGIIHVPDPEASEMLLLFVKAEIFEDADHHVATNILVDYIGHGQGSEMFQIMRQDMRAAYDPQSHFLVLGRHKALIAFSATVEAGDWLSIYDEMSAIYAAVRAGEVEVSGFDLHLNDLVRRSVDNVFNDPVWTAETFLDEYPEGAGDVIRFSIMDSLDVLDPDVVIEAAEDHLPPLEDYLLVLIGGGEGPAAQMRSNGYCAVSKGATLRDCVAALSE